MKGMTGKHASPDYGGYIGYKIFHTVITLMGVTPAYLLLAMIIPYYVIIRQSARKSASYYLKHRFPADNGLKRFFRTIKYFYAFGQILIDQAVIGIMGDKYADFEFPDGEKLLKHINGPDGIILLTTHFGNWQSAMFSMRDFGRLVHFHMQLEKHTDGRHFFDLSGDRRNFKIVPPSGFLGGMVEFTNILSSRGCVAVMGDRAWGAKTIRAKFLGEESLFPVTPYFLAYSTNSRIFMILAVRTGKLKFRIEAHELTEGSDITKMSRDEAIRSLNGKYISILQETLDRHPYQWLNFYNFWSTEDLTKKT